MPSAKTSSIIRRLPHFYSADEDSVLYLFVDLFGQVLEEAENDLLRVMNAHWVDKANNEGSRGFDTAQKGDLDKIFTLYLEALGGTSQLKQVNRGDGQQGLADDALYRARIKGLIQVLMRGASTIEGIIAIVAANLGIVEVEGASEEERAAARAARNQIRIVEFSPDATAGTDYSLTLYQPFTVINPNPTPATPQIRIHLRTDLPLLLANLKVVNVTSDEAVTYPGLLDKDDTLALFADGSALLNGVTTIVVGDVPVAPPGTSTWQLEALLQVVPQSLPLPVGRFGEGTFDPPTSDQFDTPAFMFSGPAADVNVSLTQLTPGFFTVYIPWDIPGFTEKFDDLGDDPRNQIGYIVRKVKAAGVGAAIVYEKFFAETHEMADHLFGLGERQPFAEDMEMEEFNFDIGSAQFPYPGGLDQELADNFIASGVFDFTRYDSLNTFA